MRLHLLRHAIPVPRSEGDGEDAHRPLNEEGRVQARRVAQGIEGLGIEVDAIVSGPYVRARETAERVVDVLGFRGGVRELDHLTPQSDPADTRKALADLQPAEDVLVVGHKPHLPRLVAYLLTGDPGGLDVALGKASLCTVEVALGTPEALGRLERLMQAPEVSAMARS